MNAISVDQVKKKTHALVTCEHWRSQYELAAKRLKEALQQLSDLRANLAEREGASEGPQNAGFLLTCAERDVSLAEANERAARDLLSDWEAHHAVLPGHAVGAINNASASEADRQLDLASLLGDFARILRSHGIATVFHAGKIEPINGIDAADSLRGAVAQFGRRELLSAECQAEIVRQLQGSLFDATDGFEAVKKARVA